MDLVLKDARGRMAGIEVKKTASPQSADFKGLRRHPRDQTVEKLLRGILLYTGATGVAFGPNLQALPVSAPWQFHANSAN